jgi:hypothetical protein
MVKEKFISKESIEKLADGFNTSRAIAKELGISRDALYKLTKKYNIPTLKPDIIDTNAFLEINDEYKAYWLGFMYSDGYINKRGNQLEVSLCSKDIDHLIKFKKFLCDKRGDDVIKVSKVTLKSTNKVYYRSRYVVSGKNFCQNLINQGCTNRKTFTLKFPELEESLIRHFIRGYFDGDGCIYSSRGRAAIEITSASVEFLEGIKKVFPEFNEIKKDSRNKNVNRIYCSHRKADAVLNKLYKDSNIYLDRKFNKFAGLCSDT